MSTVNGNMILDLRVWEDERLHSLKPWNGPRGNGTWEEQFADVLLPRLHGTSHMYIEYEHSGISVEGLRGRANMGYVWLHGWKDEDLVDKARELLLTNA